jgi:hypothetical protein
MAIVMIPCIFTKPRYFHTLMKYLSFLLLFPFTTLGQPLRDINYNFLYNSNEPFQFSIEAIRSSQGWTAFYDLTLRDTTQDIDQFMIQWDLRSDVSEKEGTAIKGDSVTMNRTKNGIKGSVLITTSPEIQFITAKVVNQSVKRAWVFSKLLDPKYPVNGYLMSENIPVVSSFIKKESPVVLTGEGSRKVISYYNDD